MLRKRETPEFDQVGTFIGKDVFFKGILKAASALRVDGKVEGEVQTEGDILIGEAGKVEGNLQGRNVLLAGEINGNVLASGKIEIAATGRIYGDLKAQNLVIDEGAIFQGNCQMSGTSIKKEKAEKP